MFARAASARSAQRVQHKLAILVGLALSAVQMQTAEAQDGAWRLVGAAAGHAQASDHHVHYWYLRAGSPGEGTHRVCASRGANDAQEPSWLGCTEFDPSAGLAADTPSRQSEARYAMPPAVVSVEGAAQNGEATISYLIYVLEGVASPGQPPSPVQIYCKAAVTTGRPPEVKCGRHSL